MAALTEPAKEILNILMQRANFVGIVEVEYEILGYRIPGFEDRRELIDWISDSPIRELEGLGLIEIVETNQCAQFYLPRFLLTSGQENRMRADRLRLMPYPEYLDTWEWAMRKSLVRERDENSCTRCGLYIDVREMHVHHKTYERRGIERLADLTTLCAKCHREIHRWDRRVS